MNGHDLTPTETITPPGGNAAGDLIADGKTVQAMQTPYATAVSVQKPRNLTDVKKRCLDEAVLAGEVCFYGWGSGSNRIEGPSVKCAMIAARNWGNAVVGMRPMMETPTAYIFTSNFVDLETGFTFERQFRQSKKSKVHGKHDEERKDDMRFQIGQSKSLRNCILNAIPGWLIDAMVDTAKKGVREKLQGYIDDKGIVAARELLIGALLKLGVTQERIENRLGVKIGAWDVEVLVRLKGDLSAIQDGAEDAETLFPDKEEDKPTEPVKAKAGDASTNEGFENAPKPDDPDDAARTLIEEMILEMSGGDVEEKDARMDNLNESEGLASLAGDDLGTLHAKIEEQYSDWRAAQSKTGKGKKS